MKEKVKIKMIVIVAIFFALIVSQVYADQVRYYNSAHVVGKVTVGLQVGSIPYNRIYPGDYYVVDILADQNITLPNTVVSSQNSVVMHQGPSLGPGLQRWQSDKIVIGSTDDFILVEFSAATNCTVYVYDFTADLHQASAAPGGSLRDAAGNLYQFGQNTGNGWTIYINGVYTGGVGYALVYTEGNLWTISNGGQWFVYQGGTQWGNYPGYIPATTGSDFSTPPLGQYVDTYGNIIGFGQKVSNGEYLITQNFVSTGGVGSLLVRSFGLYTTVLGADNNWWYRSGTSWVKGGYPTLADKISIPKSSRFAFNQVPLLP